MITDEVFNVTFTVKRLYSIYYGMMSRCHNKKAAGYDRYGARGIYVCDEWKERFDVFAFWALCNGYSGDLTIDRINNDDGYYPENCKWSTHIEQQNNRRSNCKISYKGGMYSAKEFADKSGLDHRTVLRKHHAGLSGEDIINNKQIPKTGHKYIFREHAKFGIRIKINNGYRVKWAKTLEEAIIIRDEMLENTKSDTESMQL